MLKKFVVREERSQKYHMLSLITKGAQGYDVVQQADGNYLVRNIITEFSALCTIYDCDVPSTRTQEHLHLKSQNPQTLQADYL